MGIVYIVVAIFVISLLAAIPLFPFWKVWARLKSHHGDLWMAKGPFDLWNMTAHPDVVRSFLDIVALADKDEILKERDPELIKWTRMSREIWRMAPTSFLGQIGYTLIFIYFVFFFTTSIMSIFVHAPS